VGIPMARPWESTPGSLSGRWRLGCGCGAGQSG
jgi:hypothetical protein